MKINDFRDLDVWQKAKALGRVTRKIIRMLPREEQYALGDQMRRSSDSIPSNIAEGQANGTTKEFINYLATARGSNAELHTQLLLCVEYGFISSADAAVAIGLSEDVGKMLHKLIQALQKRI